MKYTLLNSRFAAITLVSIHTSIAAMFQPDGGSVSSRNLGGLPSVPYSGDGLAVNSTPVGAQIRCVFQRLEGDATADGLWLRSTTTGVPKGNFRVIAVNVGRDNARLTEGFGDTPGGMDWNTSELASSGVVRVIGEFAQFIRDGVTEEYSVSVDGVRQDFLIDQPPSGSGGTSGGVGCGRRQGRVDGEWGALDA